MPFSGDFMRSWLHKKAPLPVKSLDLHRAVAATLPSRLSGRADLGALAFQPLAGGLGRLVQQLCLLPLPSSSFPAASPPSKFTAFPSTNESFMYEMGVALCVHLTLFKNGVWICASLETCALQ